jgi:hypothetical protein
MKGKSEKINKKNGRSMSCRCLSIMLILDLIKSIFRQKKKSNLATLTTTIIQIIIISKFTHILIVVDSKLIEPP